MKIDWKKTATMWGVLVLGLFIMGCLVDSDDDDDPTVPNIIGKWRTAYPDTVNSEPVDVEKILQYIADSSYTYNKITRGVDKKAIRQNGDWSVKNNKIKMEIDDSYISINDSLEVVFTPDTSTVERIFSLTGDKLSLTLFYTYVNDEGKKVDVLGTTYEYIKQ